MRAAVLLAAVALAIMARPPAARAVAPSGVDAAFSRFWAARSVDEAAKAAGEVVKSGVSFDEALGRLRRGRPYRADVPRGVVKASRRTIAGDFPYLLDAPAAYTPSRAYPVRIQLHGGVMTRDDATPRAGRGGSMNVSLRGADDEFYVVPTAWRDEPWWSDEQLENVRAILDLVKRTYNVDENRVALTGVSDGATATYYFAMRDPTPYASFEPLNGFPMVLANRALDVAGELYPNNLRNKPFLAINGDLDPLYPSGSVGPYLEALARRGVAIDFRTRADGVHNTAWWPEMKGPVAEFLRAHPRQPYPDRLTWETERGDVHNRVHWLVVDQLTGRRNAPLVPDFSALTAGGDAAPLRLQFVHSRPSGRVDLVRRGNVVDAATDGVGAFTLLVSPDAFDLSRPVVVHVNGTTAFDGMVHASVAILMKWAARDNDRTMLFAAELHVQTR